MTDDDELATRLEEMADRLEAQGVDYKPNSYRRAAESIREQPRSVADLAREDPEALRDVDGVGEAIASKLEEYVETGAIGELEALREELPVDMAGLTAVEGVGPKTIGTLYEALGVEDLDDLEAAAREERIQDVKGFGAKTEANILDGIEFARQAGDRLLLGEARPVADEALATLRAEPAVETVEVAGSIRRWRETIGDVDVLVATDDADPVVAALTDWDAVDGVIEAGDQKASVRVDGVRVDLRAVVPDEFGAALQYFTGSKDHNVHLRNLAIERDLKMNEYGVFDVADVADDDQRAGERVAGAEEGEMYAALDLPWIPPELRRDTGEIAAAAEGDLPDLLEAGAIRGDLHAHTDWSGDCDTPIAEMVAAAAAAGREYHAVTDHADGPGTAPGTGISEAEIRDAVAEVAADADIEVLHGVEANVDAEGAVGVSDGLLADLDVVVASPHVALSQDATAATDRLVRAVEHPHVDVLGHPSGRLLNERAGLEFDVERVAAAAADNGTALEINGDPHRLDLWGDAVQVAVEAGALVAVDTDAHRPGALAYTRYGVHTARRGWAGPDDVLNARDVEGLREFLG
jgi:DNA polymerase (family 10)